MPSLTLFPLPSLSSMTRPPPPRLAAHFCPLSPPSLTPVPPLSSTAVRPKICHRDPRPPFPPTLPFSSLFLAHCAFLVFSFPPSFFPAHVWCLTRLPCFVTLRLDATTLSPCSAPPACCARYATTFPRSVVYCVACLVELQPCKQQQKKKNAVSVLRIVRL